ncbi:hypothetical protein B5U98_23930 [Bosea sp. Tri-39]|nr:hypothetical protein B5U98_23930 [Bosea sp. Tri-39]RXT32906.1 hypothetical protein B5U99_30275 [Bosea sp. Tri-54]
MLAADQSAVIGFCGLAGSGKTTLAEYLVEHHGFVRVPFAGPLKAMAAAFGLTPAEMSGSLKEEPCEALCGKTPRQFMQLLGTEFGRQMLGPDLWVNAWRRAVARHLEEALVDDRPLRIVCDDVRFANEAAPIRALGGRVVMLLRRGAGSKSGFSHPSEALDFLPDKCVGNDREIQMALEEALA